MSTDSNYTLPVGTYTISGATSTTRFRLYARDENDVEIWRATMDAPYTFSITKDIAKTLSIDGIGAIEYNKTIWKAKSVDDKEIKAGNFVEIVSRENMIKLYDGGVYLSDGKIIPENLADSGASGKDKRRRTHCR